MLYIRCWRWLMGKKKRKRDNIRRRKSLVWLSRRWTIARSFSSIHCSKLVDLSIRFSNILLRWKQHAIESNTGVSEQQVVKYISCTKNLRFVSVDCQVLLSTAASMHAYLSCWFSFSLSLPFCLKCLYLLSLSLSSLDAAFFWRFIVLSFSSAFQLDCDYLFCSFLNSFSKKREWNLSFDSPVHI